MQLMGSGMCEDVLRCSEKAWRKQIKNLDAFLGLSFTHTKCRKCPWNLRRHNVADTLGQTQWLVS